MGWLAKAAQKVLRVLVEMWTPHGPNLDSVTFDGEVGYELPVARVTDEQKERCGLRYFFALKKGAEWPLLNPIFFYWLAHQLVYY